MKFDLDDYRYHLKTGESQNQLLNLVKSKAAKKLIGSCLSFKCSERPSASKALGDLDAFKSVLDLSASSESNENKSTSEESDSNEDNEESDGYEDYDEKESDCSDNDYGSVDSDSNIESNNN